MEKIKWEKQIPDKAGYWLRVNAGHRIEVKQVFDEGYGLEIIWGWGGSQKVCKVKDVEERLRSFFWFGPILEPPKKAFE